MLETEPTGKKATEKEVISVGGGGTMDAKGKEDRMRFHVKKNLGLWLCIPAVLFLFHPVVAFVDILPDFIGYLLLYAALGQAADLNDKISESRTTFRKMMWIGVAAFAVQCYLYGVLPGNEQSMNAYETPVWVLLCSFVMFLLQWYFLIPAYRNLFLGLGELTEFAADVRVLRVRRGRTRYERLARFSAVFVFLSSGLSLLPELTVLTTFEYEAENAAFDWYRFVVLLRGMAFVISLVIGLCWLVRVCCLIGATCSQKACMDELEQRYVREVLPQTGVLTGRRIKFSFSFLAVAIFFLPTLRMDGIEILPSVVCAVLLLPAVLLLGNLIQVRRAFWGSLIVLFGVGCFRMYYENAFLNLYTSFEASFYRVDAYHDFFFLRMVELAEEILLPVVLCLLLKMLFDMVRAETAEVYSNDVGGVSVAATEKMHRKFRIRFMVVGVLFLLSGVSNAVASFFRLQISWLWWIAFAISVLAVIGFLSLLFAILEQLEWQYSKFGLHKTLP